MQLVKEVVPDQVTLVPDPPGAITSSEGWDTITNKNFLIDVIWELKSVGIRTSIFVDMRPEMIENAADTGTDRVELYTEPYASQFKTDPQKAVEAFVGGRKESR